MYGYIRVWVNVRVYTGVGKCTGIYRCGYVYYTKMKICMYVYQTSNILILVLFVFMVFCITPWVYHCLDVKTVYKVKTNMCYITIIVCLYVDAYR